jgi:hypothetical protein
MRGHPTGEKKLPSRPTRRPVTGKHYVVSIVPKEPGSKFKVPVLREPSPQNHAADDSDDDEKARRIESPGQVWPLAVMEQIEVPGVGHRYVIDEQMPDGTWRTKEDSSFPDPNGKGVYIPFKQVPWPLPGAPIDYGNEIGLHSEIVKFLRHYWESRDEIVYDLLACFILMTWRFEEFNVLPYLDALGPKSTGKTKLLELLASVSYRGWLITHPTPAAVFWIVDRYHPTLLADNYEFWAKETRRELDGLFNAGYRKGATVPRRPREGESGADLDIYDVYCPKVLSGTREPSDALESRCIRVRTTRTRRAMPMTIDETWARELRNKLLQYRLRHLEATRRPDEEILNKYGRVGETFHALLTVAPDEETANKISDYSQGVFQEQVEEEATGEEAEVVRAINASQADADQGRLPIALIVEKMNEGQSEEEKVSSRRVGWITKRLGFKKCRMPDAKGSRGIVLDRDLLDHLLQQYGLEETASISMSNTPQKTSERQNVRNEAGSITPSPDVSDNLTITGGDRGTPSASSRHSDLSETERALAKLRTINGPFSLDYALEQVCKVTGDRAKAEAYLKQFQDSGLILRDPEGYWRLGR